MGELESIRIFLAVAKNRSFAGAARELGLAPAAVTRTIAALEDQLGVQLLLRTTRSVSLTSAGAAYAARVGPLATELARAAQETREGQGRVSGTLRISAPMSLGLRMLPEVLSQFSTIHPETQVSLNLTDHFVDIVEDGFDLAIRISGPPSDKSTIWRKICEVPRILAAAPDWLLRNGPVTAPSALRPTDCLAYCRDGEEDRWQLSLGSARHNVHAAGRFRANNGDLLADLAANGEGVVMLPRFILADHLRSGRLVQILPDWDASPIWLTLFYPPYDRLPLRVATFSDFFEVFARQTRPL